MLKVVMLLVKQVKFFAKRVFDRIYMLKLLPYDVVILQFNYNNLQTFDRMVYFNAQVLRKAGRCNLLTGNSIVLFYLVCCDQKIIIQMIIQCINFLVQAFKQA